MPKEYRALMTVNLPVRLVERLEPYAGRRQRSLFIQRLIEAELDRVEQDQDQDREHDCGAA